jgi:hypothetical protein
MKKYQMLLFLVFTVAFQSCNDVTRTSKRLNNSAKESQEQVPKTEKESKPETEKPSKDTETNETVQKREDLIEKSQEDSITKEDISEQEDILLQIKDNDLRVGKKQSLKTIVSQKKEIKIEEAKELLFNAVKNSQQSKAGEFSYLFSELNSNDENCSVKAYAHYKKVADKKQTLEAKILSIGSNDSLVRVSETPICAQAVLKTLQDDIGYSFIQRNKDQSISRVSYVYDIELKDQCPTQNSQCKSSIKTYKATLSAESKFEGEEVVIVVRTIKYNNGKDEGYVARDAESFTIFGLNKKLAGRVIYSKSVADYIDGISYVWGNTYSQTETLELINVQ